MTTIAALAAADPDPELTFAEQLAELLPSHTYIAELYGTVTATWSTPAGVWKVTRQPTRSAALDYKTQIRGPKTSVEMAHCDLRLIVKALNVLGAISLALLDSDGEVRVLDEQNGNIRLVRFLDGHVVRPPADPYPIGG